LNWLIIIIGLSVLWLGSEIGLSRLKRAAATDRRVDRSSFRLLWVVILLAVTVGVLIGLQRVGRFGGGSGRLPVAGIILIIGGLLIRWLAIFSLRRQFTVDVAISPDHRLITAGIYHYLRHPAYAGSLLSFLGLGLLFSNYLSVLTIFVPICSAFLYRIHVEEKALIEAFGADYLDYCASTKRLIPGIF